MPRVARAIAAVVLSFHVFGAIEAVLLLPRWFPLVDIHTWSNTVIPIACALASVIAIVFQFRRHSSSAGVSALIAAAAGGWIAAATTGAILFPISMGVSRIAPPLVFGLLLGAIAWGARHSLALSLPSFAVGAGLGFVCIFAQRAPAPSTRPAGATLAEVRGTPSNDDASTGQIVVACGKGTIKVNPLLTFQSRSPDRTWTVLARPEDFGPHRNIEQYAKTPTGFRAFYTDDGESTLVATKDKAGLLSIEAVSRLLVPVYAHLDTFTTIHVPFEASIAFGPTGSTRYSIEPTDYPSGRPAQLAYLDRELAFRVVRASDAEKGPYATLGEGRLRRDDPLTIDLRPKDDDKTKGCRLVFKDWSAQVSTEPSPTAGFGVPQNSIQFFDRGGEAIIILTLAETGPGRGFDSVGHAPGTYVNRIRVEALR